MPFHNCTSKYKRYYLASVIARKVELKAMAPSSQIKEEHELEEHAAFQLHKAVVRHGFRKIRLHRTLNEEQVVVLEIAECTEMEIQQDSHYFTV